MKCHRFLRPIRRDLPSTFCTTLLNGVNHISKYLQVLLLYKLFDLSDLQFANKAKQISHVLLLYEFIHVCGNLVIFLYFMNTVEPRFNEPLYNEVLGITIFFNKRYGTEPRYNKPRFCEILVITDTIQKRKSKIYLDVRN